MPKQEFFYEQATTDGRRIEVLKSYDQSYAREVFTNMDSDALQRLWSSLEPEKTYEPAELPSLNDRSGDGEAFLWDELLEASREDGQLLSFFVVNEIRNQRVESLFVSPDWPSAEAFAKERILAQV